MFRYRNEAEFSRAFCKQLERNNWFVQRIETGFTGRGVPDIYAISPTKQAVWFELKRVHVTLLSATKTVIPWRVGQQAWLAKVTKYGQLCFTIACFDDVIIQIPHDKTYPNNEVNPFHCWRFTHIGDIK